MCVCVCEGGGGYGSERVKISTKYCTKHSLKGKKKTNGKTTYFYHNGYNEILLSFSH